MILEQNVVHLGNCIELCIGIPDNSIDLIIADPPYDFKHLYLYEWLAKTANRVLKPGRFMFAYGGYIDELYLSALGHSGMKQDFVHILRHKGNNPRWWSKKRLVGYKPVYSFSKGDPERNSWMNTYHEPERDKRFHKWGQGIGFPIQIVEMLTMKGETVLDPFCGGGQIASVCKMLKRNFVTMDISQEAVKVARERIAQIQVSMDEVIGEYKSGKPEKEDVEMPLFERYKRW